MTTANQHKTLDMLEGRAARALSRAVEFRRQRFEGLAKLIDSLSYKSVLRRGYALVRTETGTPVHQAAAVKPWQPLTIEFADGEVRVREDSARQGRLL